MNNGRVPGMAQRLLNFISHVSADDFYRHDTHYNRDSRLGRELLYLIANDDWIRSTTEIINLNRGDSVDSVVKVNVDTGKITHEAFGDGTRPLWLPLLVLTMPDSADSAPAASPGQLTVIDANGSVLAPMREADVWHAISAALAEIFITIADTRWPWPAERRPGADRDQRVLLSAAIFRMLSGTGGRDWGTDAGTGAGAGGSDDKGRYEETASPLGEAKRKLGILLRRYSKAYDRPAQGGPSMAADMEAKLLTERAAELLYAFTKAVVVVVGVERSDARAMLTLTAPTRNLIDKPRPVHRVLRQLQPRARLDIDLLLASGDADRQVEIAVPEGVSIDLSARPAPDATPGLDADIVVTVDPPPAAARLATLMDSVLAEDIRPVRECLAGLAFTQADTLAQILNQHLVLGARPAADGPAAPGNTAPGPAPGPGPAEPYQDLYQRTDDANRSLERLRDQLRRVAACPPDPEAALADLRATWADGDWLRHLLLRRAAISLRSPDTLTGRTGLIENTRQRVAPGSAKVTVPLEVADARFYSVARFSGLVSIVLMVVVLSFYAFALVRHTSDGSPDPAVLASVLTLFSVIQAGRVESPDRSTLRGKLTGAGNWLIIASILPTVVLAIAIAFGITGWTPVWWSVGAIVAQTLFLLTMWRGPLSAAGGHRQQPYRVLRTTPTPAYGKTGVLRAVWWQTATANALILGRQAHGYLIWEHRSEPEVPGPQSLRPVLGRLQPGFGKAIAVVEKARLRTGAASTVNTNGVFSNARSTTGNIANILAMMRSGTTREAVTFVVLREPPAGLPPDAHVVPLEIDPDRLTPAEAATEHIDVQIGVPGSDQFLPLGEHPVVTVLRAARNQWLQVMETQLPVLPPTMAAPPDTLWARVRVGFRDPEYGRIAGFLREIAAIGYPVWVRSWPEHIPRSLRTVPEAEVSSAPRGTSRYELMTAQDFDVVSVARRHGADSRARTWRMLGLCVNTALGGESAVIDALAAQVPGLQLAAMSHAELHGMDMFLILGHVAAGSHAAAGNHAPTGSRDTEAGAGDDTGAGGNGSGDNGSGDNGSDGADEPDGACGTGDLERALASAAKAPTLRVVLDEWRTAEELGFAKPGPLLRVDVRTRDTPGTLQVVLDALRRALAKQLPSLPETADMSDWRVVLQTGAGHTALARLTLGLPVPLADVRAWPPARWAEVARDALANAADAVADRGGTTQGGAGTGAGYEDFNVPEDMVISIRPVKRERPLPQPSRQDAPDRQGC